MNYKLRSTLNDLWYTKARHVFSFLYLLLAFVAKLLGKKRLAFMCCAASLRYASTSSALNFLAKILSGYTFSLGEFSSGVEIKEASCRSIVLAWPCVKDNSIIKGVLAISFTRTFSFYLRNVDLESLEKYFTLVLEPSWSGYADPDILGFIGRSKKIIVQASELEDRVLLNCFPDAFVAVSFGASDWVDYRLFNDLKMEKIYDSIYIANTNPIKRVKRYIEAVSEIVKTDNKYVGCLVCASWGGAESLVRQLVESYKLDKNLVVRFSLSQSEVARHINQSKVNVLLSYKEGSNRSLFEAIFCNTPIICLSENIGVNKSYINEYTGLLVPDSLLESSLVWISENHSRFNARSWAINNISPSVTTQKLTRLISGFSDFTNHPSLYVKTNNPEYSYFDFPQVDSAVYTEKVLRLFANDSALTRAREIELENLKNDFLVELESSKENSERGS